jgi:hypothetical protein
MNVSIANTITVPTDDMGGFMLGDTIVVGQVGPGVTTIVPDTGVTINTPRTLVIAQRYGKATLTNVGTNEWDIEGNLAS